jgi:hypothetical protein
VTHMKWSERTEHLKMLQQLFVSFGNNEWFGRRSSMDYSMCDGRDIIPERAFHLLTDRAGKLTSGGFDEIKDVFETFFS